MAGRRTRFGGTGGTPYTSWTLPKLRAELSRRGMAWSSYDKKATLVRKLRSAVAPSDGSHIDVGDASPTRQSGPSVQPATTEVEFLRGEVRRLQETIARIEGASASSSGPAPRTVTATPATTEDRQLPPWNPHDDVTATAGTSGIPGIPRPCQRREETPILRDVDRVPQGSTPGAGAFAGHLPPNQNGGHFGTLYMPQLTPGTSTGQGMPAPQQALQGIGVPSSALPQIEIVSPALRNDIIQGRDVNLASLLIQGFTSDGELGQRTAAAGDDVVPLKPLRDHRLTRQLTITEFVKAFTIYRNIMCEVYPHRRSELDSYLRLIVDMATDFGGNVFYEYHRMFSARAASYLIDYGIKIDWSRRDNDMYCKLFAGRRANSCDLCGSMGHPTGFCPHAATENQRNFRKQEKKSPQGNQNHVTMSKSAGKGDTYGRPRVMYGNVEICNNFNSARGCQRGRECRLAHLCLTCKGAEHSMSECAKGKKLPNSSGNQTATAPAPSTNTTISKRPNWLSVSPITINIDRLKHELKGHPDRDFVRNLIRGLEEGFYTGVTSPPEYTYECKNNMSALKNPGQTQELLQIELDKGYLIGPYTQSPFENFRINPLSVASRKYSEKKRLVVDMSAPHECEVPSINSLISKEEFSLSYVKIDEAVQIIQSLGKGSWLCKTDLVDAFKTIPVHPDVWPLQGVKWKNEYYFFTRLVFGCRSSPKIFNALSQAIAWISKNNYGIANILYLLDDFLTLDSPEFEASRTMALLTTMFKRLGIQLSSRKTCGPTRCLEYLGITIDTVAMECRLPVDKLERISNMVQSFIGRRTCSKQEMLSLLGHLNFACRVIPAGRSFMSRLFVAAHSVKKLHHKVTLNQETRADLEMWAIFLQQWNGISLFLDLTETESDDMALFTDASGTIGFGGYFQNQWFYSAWPNGLIENLDSTISIAFQELYPIVVAAILWGKAWARRKVVFHCDNQATVQILNKARSKSKDIMKLMRRLTLVAASYSFSYHGRWIPGKTNTKADALSRLQISTFKRLAPEAAQEPCPIPFDSVYLWIQLNITM